MRKIDRTGEVSYTKYGTQILILKYYSNRKVLVQFQDEYKYECFAEYKQITNKSLKNPYDKTVYQHGYFGVGDYKSSYNGKRSFVYDVWKDMLKRCYSSKSLKRNTSYKGCFVCNEWLNFQNFAKWFCENYYSVKNQRMCVDKDILKKGNKQYSPQTCCIVPHEINMIVVGEKSNRGNLPIGVKKVRSKYVAQCRATIIPNKNKSRYIGTYNTIEEAFNSYKIHKEIIIKKVADKYKDVIPQKVYDALYSYEVLITD